MLIVRRQLTELGRENRKQNVAEKLVFKHSKPPLRNNFEEGLQANKTLDPVKFSSNGLYM